MKKLVTMVFACLFLFAGTAWTHPTNGLVSSWSFDDQIQGFPPVVIGLGDSIGEGVQSADASLRSQPSVYLNLLAKQMGAAFPLPWIKSGLFGVVGETSNRSRLLAFIPASNLSVSGADVNSLINEQANATTVEEIDSETDLVLFPRLGSQLEIAESAGSPINICWIGNNDALSAAISFDRLDASQLTPIPAFEADFNEIVQRLVKPGKIVVFANIPNVTNIAFLVDRQDLIKFLGSDYGLADGDFTSIVVLLLIRLGWDDGSLLQDPNYVLDAGEVQIIQDRIAAFNQIIDDAATAVGMPVVDANKIFDEIAQNPPVILGIPITPRFLGGVFSLDGVHPSNIAHAIMTNAFIRTINLHFNAQIPSIATADMLKIFITDPFVDKDDDGRVRGRPGAGLLETLGPLLGISGDENDFVPDNFGPRIEVSKGKQFIEAFLALQRKDPLLASQWEKEDVIEAFRDIFGLRKFHSASRP